MAKLRETLALLTILLSLALLYKMGSPKTTPIAKMYPEGTQSAKVMEIVGKGMGGSVLLVITKRPYYSLPDTFATRINETLKKYGTSSRMDYFTLRNMVFNKLNASISNYVISNYKYITYLKSFVQQLDAIDIYVYENTYNAWNLYKKLSNFTNFYSSLVGKYLKASEKARKAEERIISEVSELELRVPEEIVKLNATIKLVKHILNLFQEFRQYYKKSYEDVLRLLNETCKGKISVRQAVEILSNGTGLEGAIRQLMASAFMTTWLSWPSKPCKNSEDFVQTVLSIFASGAPEALSSLGPEYGLTVNQMKNLALLASTISPNAKGREVLDAMIELVRLILSTNTKMATLYVEAAKGNLRALAELAVINLGVKNNCLAKAVYESLVRGLPLSVTSAQCEEKALKEIAKKLSIKDKDFVWVALSSLGLDPPQAKWLASEEAFNDLVSWGVPPSDAVWAFYGKINVTRALEDTLASQGILYYKYIVKAILQSKSLPTAQRKAVMLVFNQLAKTMYQYGFSKKAIDTLIYGVLALGPGLNDEQVNEVVYKTVLTEIEASKDPRVILLKSLTNINSFVKDLVWSNDVKEALRVVQKYSVIMTNNFMKKYVALKLLVGNDGKHLLFMLSNSPKEAPPLPFKHYLIDPKEINSEIQKSINKDLNEVNVFAVVLVLLALLFSTKSLKLSIIPVIIIYTVLKYYNLMVNMIGFLGLRPTSIDLVIATATILGMGIDYSLYAAARYSGKLWEALKPVLIAASMASLGFAVFGLLAYLLIPGLATLGLFVPLAILFTAIVGPLLTILIKAILNIKEETGSYKVPYLTKLGTGMPKIVVLTTIILALGSLYLVLYYPPGYDLFLFLPSNAKVIKAIKVLQDHSSPGITGPTIILLKVKEKDLSAIAKSVEELCKYFLATGYFDYAFTITRPLGKFVSTNPKLLEVLGMNNYIKGDYVVLYLIPHYPPDGNVMISYVKEMRQFLKRWVLRTPFSEALVGGESALNYDLSLAISQITLYYVIPIMVIVTGSILSLMFKREEIVLSAVITSLSVMLVSLGISILTFKALLHVTPLWIVMPLTITAVLSVGSDYLVFYFFGLKNALESCKIVEGDECVSKINALYYNAAKNFNLILGFATTFTVAYFALLKSNIWALREIGLSLGLIPILLILALFGLVPAILVLIYKE